MTTHIGNEGSVKFGSNAVGEVRSWSINEQAATVDDSAIGDSWDTHLVGSKSWDGEMECAYDPTDTDGQAAVRAGDSVTLNLYAVGPTTGNKYFTGTATIEKMGRQTSRNGLIVQSFTFKGNGQLSISTAA
jgi:hypothetical protein